MEPICPILPFTAADWALWAGASRFSDRTDPLVVRVGYGSSPARVDTPSGPQDAARAVLYAEGGGLAVYYYGADGAPLAAYYRIETLRTVGAGRAALDRYLPVVLRGEVPVEFDVNS